MRLFQVLDGITGEPRGIYTCTQPEAIVSDDKVEEILKDYFDLMENEIEEDDAHAEELLDISCIERVFVTEFVI